MSRRGVDWLVGLMAFAILRTDGLPGVLGYA
jgi:hypothetical protein